MKLRVSGSAGQLRSKSFYNCRVLDTETQNVDNANFTGLRNSKPPALEGSV